MCACVYVCFKHKIFFLFSAFWRFFIKTILILSCAYNLTFFVSELTFLEFCELTKIVSTSLSKSLRVGLLTSRPVYELTKIL